MPANLATYVFAVHQTLQGRSLCNTVSFAMLQGDSSLGLPWIALSVHDGQLSAFSAPYALCTSDYPFADLLWQPSGSPGFFTWESPVHSSVFSADYFASALTLRSKVLDTLFLIAGSCRREESQAGPATQAAKHANVLTQGGSNGPEDFSSSDNAEGARGEIRESGLSPPSRPLAFSGLAQRDDNVHLGSPAGMRPRYRMDKVS